MADEDEPGAIRESPADGYAFIGAVHRLVTAPSMATKADLLLSASCQALRDSPRAVEDVLQVVNNIWPGSQTDAASVRSALDLGRTLGLVQATEAIDASELWELTARGLEDVGRQVQWVDELKSRTLRDLQSRALDDLQIDLSTAQAEVWLDWLVKALIDGIQSSQDAYFGHVDHLAGRQLSPRGIDQKRVLEGLADPRIDLVTSQFLQAAALSAFDPLDPFASDLVSTITTGCVLHSYVAGRDSADVMSRLGAPQGQRALIDTPVLVDLLGPVRVAQSVKVVLSAAVAAGWEVIVCDHSIEELIGLLEREIPEIQASFTDAHNKGVRQEWYASLTEGQLPAYCVEVLRDGTYLTLDAMVDAARNIEVVLDELGITVRPHGNGDSSSVDRCKSSLEQEFTDTGAHRSAAAIERDAQSMAVVWRRRQRQTGNTWPGGWIITPDGHIGPAYRRVAQMTLSR